MRKINPAIIFGVLSLFSYAVIYALSGCTNQKSINEDAKLIMHFVDASRNGVEFSKDPHVIKFGDKYLMYYSMGPTETEGWTVGIAESKNLIDWTPIGFLDYKHDAGHYSYVA